MTDVFSLTGTLQTVPADASASGLSTVISQLSESLILQTKCVPGEYDLQSDSPQVVAFGALAFVNVIFVKVNGGSPITLAMTSSAGTLQATPVDSVAFIISQGVNITAIEITRTPGVETLVDIILGQAA